MFRVELGNKVDYSRAHNLKDKEVQDNAGCLQEQAAPL